VFDVGVDTITHLSRFGIAGKQKKKENGKNGEGEKKRVCERPRAFIYIRVRRDCRRKRSVEATRAKSRIE
jgi:hypothetical protein